MRLRRRFACRQSEGDAPGPLSKPDCIGSSFPTDTCRAKLTLLLVILDVSDSLRAIGSVWIIYTDGGRVGYLQTTTKWLGSWLF